MMPPPPSRTRPPPRLRSALPLQPQGDGLLLCTRFCRMFGRPEPGTRHGPPTAQVRIPLRLRLKDGPYLCVCQCRGFAARRPLTIRRPRWRGFADALRRSKEVLQ